MYLLWLSVLVHVRVTMRIGRAWADGLALTYVEREANREGIRSGPAYCIAAYGKALVEALIEHYISK